MKNIREILPFIFTTLLNYWIFLNFFNGFAESRNSSNYRKKLFWVYFRRTQMRLNNIQIKDKSINLIVKWLLKYFASLKHHLLSYLTLYFYFFTCPPPSICVCFAAVENCIAMKLIPSSNRQGMKVYIIAMEIKRKEEIRMIFSSFNGEMTGKDINREWTFSTCLWVHKIKYTQPEMVVDGEWNYV